MRSKILNLFLTVYITVRANFLQKSGFADKNSCQTGCDKDRAKNLFVPERRDTDLSEDIN